jgi:RNA polymerase sigma-70 factor (ECF subfamily)
VFIRCAGGEVTVAIDVESFYRRYGPMVLRRCLKLLRTEAQAQDAMQDVFVSVLSHEARLDESAPSALLLRIATNVCLNRLRTRRRRPEDADDDLLLRIAAAGGDSEGQTLARGMLARLFGGEGPLEASSRTIAVMHLVDGMTLEEVAAETGMSVSGVRKRLRTLRARLVALETASVQEGA